MSQAAKGIGPGTWRLLSMALSSTTSFIESEAYTSGSKTFWSLFWISDMVGRAAARETSVEADADADGERRWSGVELE